MNRLGRRLAIGVTTIVSIALLWSLARAQELGPDRDLFPQVPDVVIPPEAVLTNCPQAVDFSMEADFESPDSYLRYTFNWEFGIAYLPGKTVTYHLSDGFSRKLADYGYRYAKAKNVRINAHCMKWPDANGVMKTHVVIDNMHANIFETNSAPPINMEELTQTDEQPGTPVMETWCFFLNTWSESGELISSVPIEGACWQVP